MFLTFSGSVSGLEDELKHIKTSLSKAEAEKRQLQEDLTALEKVCVCVCVCVWFMRTQICIMTWVLQGEGDLWGQFQYPHNSKGL